MKPAPQLFVIVLPPRQLAALLRKARREIPELRMECMRRILQIVHGPEHGYFP
jgi:hypothetical protein